MRQMKIRLADLYILLSVYKKVNNVEGIDACYSNIIRIEDLIEGAQNEA